MLAFCLDTFADSSEMIKVITIKLGMVTASDRRMRQVFIILTEFDLHSRPKDRTHENNKCLIISETVQAIPIKFAVKIVRQKVYVIFSQSDDLAVHARSQLRLKVDKCLTCTIILIAIIYLGQYLSYGILTWHDGRSVHGISAHDHFDDLEQGHSGSAKAKINCVLNYFDN